MPFIKGLGARTSPDHNRHIYSPSKLALLGTRSYFSPVRFHTLSMFTHTTPGAEYFIQTLLQASLGTPKLVLFTDEKLGRIRSRLEVTEQASCGHCVFTAFTAQCFPTLRSPFFSSPWSALVSFTSQVRGTQETFTEQTDTHSSKGPLEAMLVMEFSELQLKSIHLCRSPLLDTKSQKKLECWASWYWVCSTLLVIYETGSENKVP